MYKIKQKATFVTIYRNRCCFLKIRNFKDYIHNVNKKITSDMFDIKNFRLTLCIKLLLVYIFLAEI